ncbi:MAG: response regulator transcription factor [Candidatus Omnitrophica bacterium]|nr:response regulator transcription factor [Candidatus Omnitrophota bacterium]
MMSQVRVFLCDDHTLFRQGVKKLLDLEKDIKVVGEAGDAYQMFEALRSLAVDIVLLDINMPKMDGVKATFRIRKEHPHVAVVILTVHEDEPYIFQAIKAGAMGYLLKDVSIKELAEAVRKVSEGEALLQPIIASKVLKEFVMLDKRKAREGQKSGSNLTAREEEILRFIAMGDSNKEIAQKIGITEKTVKNHVSNILTCLHVNNRTQAALYALGKTPAT